MYTCIYKRKSCDLISANQIYRFRVLFVVVSHSHLFLYSRNQYILLFAVKVELFTTCKKARDCSQICKLNTAFFLIQLIKIVIQRCHF